MEHKFQTINTEEFVNYLNAKLLVPNKIAVNVEEWIYESGVPSNCPVIERNNLFHRQCPSFQHRDAFDLTLASMLDQLPILRQLIESNLDNLI